MDEITKLKRRYAHQIEDGRRIDVITTMPEWQWYVEHVINPTIDDYTNRILTGVIASDKEDWILRGMIMGMKLVVDTTANFKQVADEAKKKSRQIHKVEEDEY